MIGAAAIARRAAGLPPVRACVALARAHTVRKLRWARNGVLAALAVTAAVCLLVSVQAHREITPAARHSAGAITEIDAARHALVQADAALVNNFDHGDIALTGPGSAYADGIAAANEDLVLAAGDNVAGAEGSARIQFSEGLLITYTSLVDQAVTDYSAGSDHTLGMVELWYASDLLHSGPIPELEKLHRTEQAALDGQRRSVWLSPAKFWWPLLVPVLALLVLVVATSWLLRMGFRRLVSVRLVLTVLLSATAAVTVGWATVRDEQHLAAAVSGPLAHQSDDTLRAIANTDIASDRELEKVLRSAPDTAGYWQLEQALQSYCLSCTGPAGSIDEVIARDMRSASAASGAKSDAPAGAARHLAATHHLETTNYAGGPMTLTIVFVLLATGVALAYTAYRPRLDEYRFQAS